MVANPQPPRVQQTLISLNWLITLLLPCKTDLPMIANGSCLHIGGVLLVGATRFEHATPWSQTRCSTKLSHAPEKCGKPGSPVDKPGRRSNKIFMCEIFHKSIESNLCQCYMTKSFKRLFFFWYIKIIVVFVNISTNICGVDFHFSIIHIKYDI